MVGDGDASLESLHPGDWPSLEEGFQVGKGAQRRLTLIPQKFSEWCVDSSGYHPTTRGGQKQLRLQIEKEIKCQLFTEQQWVSELRDLAAASDRLEESLEKMLKLDSGREAIDKKLVAWDGRGKEDKPVLNSVDFRFDHSWTPPGPRPGWFWIPKGRMCLDILYPATRGEVRRFGYLARKVCSTHPPLLTKSFAEAVNPSTMAHNRPTGKRRQEEWMDGDDLLGGDLGKEQDLRLHLQRGGRSQGEPP